MFVWNVYPIPNPIPLNLPDWRKLQVIDIWNKYKKEDNSKCRLRKYEIIWENFSISCFILNSEMTK